MKKLSESGSAPEARPHGRLSRDDLHLQWRRTLEHPRLAYGRPARLLFRVMDLVYGEERSLFKFKVLEIVARVPYQAWENVAYVAVTHRYSKPAFTRRVIKRLEESRDQQDNEQWHLLIVDELLRESPTRQPFLTGRVIPQVLALTYYWLSWLLYVLRPGWSYRLNADFEDHAEHEYALFVREHSELDERGYTGQFADEYGSFLTLSDLFRQIGYDERMHKEESLAHLDEPRFR